jgi:hypothetical protein
MDPLLVALVIVSLLAAAGFGAFAWHLLREERQRSAARVAALAAALDAGTPAARPTSVGELFKPEASAAARGNPMIKIAVGIAMAIILIIVIASADRGPTREEDSTRVQTADAQPATRGPAALELVSLRHTREGATLTVSGLVRNPRAGATVSRVTAVVLAFNSGGAFVASGRAALDFTTLDPGDESPFVVTIAGVTDVARYRVSFRTESGGVMRHIDRRSDQMRLTAAVNLQ